MPPISENNEIFPDVPLIEIGDLVVGGSESSGPNKALKPLVDRSGYNKRLIEDIIDNSSNLIVGQDVQAWAAFLDAIAALSGGGLLRRFSDGTAGLVGTWVDPMTAGGRLSLVSGDSFNSNDVVNANRLYYTPHSSSVISLYSSGEWRLFPFVESSVSLSALAAFTNYDVFIYLNGSSLSFELQLWTDSTTRSVALQRQDGVWVKLGDPTRRYVGTIRTGSAGSVTNSQQQRFVFNTNNRLPHILRRKPDVNSWNANGTGWRAANGNPSNQVQIVSGLRELVVDLQVFGLGSNNAKLGIAINTVGPANTDFGVGVSDATQTTTIGSIYREVPRIGHSFYQMVEQSQDGTSVFDGDNTAMSGVWYC